MLYWVTNFGDVVGSASTGRASDSGSRPRPWAFADQNGGLSQAMVPGPVRSSSRTSTKHRPLARVRDQGGRFTAFEVPKTLVADLHEWARLVCASQRAHADCDKSLGGDHRSQVLRWIFLWRSPSKCSAERWLVRELGNNRGSRTCGIEYAPITAQNTVQLDAVERGDVVDETPLILVDLLNRGVVGELEQHPAWRITDAVSLKWLASVAPMSLISVDQQRRGWRILSSRRSTVVCDCRFYLADHHKGRHEGDKAHIPGRALFVDVHTSSLVGRGKAAAGTRFQP